MLTAIQDRLVYFVNKISGVSDTDSQGELEGGRNNFSKMTSLPEEEAILFDNYSYYDGDYPVYEEGDIPAIPLDGNNLRIRRREKLFLALKVMNFFVFVLLH